jgi:chromate transporter
MALGLQRGGYAGALAAWAGFTLPSAIALIGLALGLRYWDMAQPVAQGALHGLKVVAVAVVAQAVWGMARQLCPDGPRRLLALITAALALLWPTPWMQVGLMTLAGLLGASGALRLPVQQPADAALAGQRRSTRGGALWLALFFILLLGLPMWAQMADSPVQPVLALIDAFYRAGALVFGGGHVVLPLLQAEVVPTGWVGADAFLAGYGAAPAMPGPLFTFAAFLGAARGVAPTGWLGGLIALLAIFTPAFLLVAGALPFWERLRHSPLARKALLAINAAVVGVLLAALIDPVGRLGLRSLPDVLLAVLALLALLRWRAPPWIVVLACAAAGAVMAVV